MRWTNSYSGQVNSPAARPTSEGEIDDVHRTTIAQTASEKLSCDVDRLVQKRGGGHDLFFANLDLTLEGEPGSEGSITGLIQFYNESEHPPDHDPVSEMIIVGEWSTRATSEPVNAPRVAKLRLITFHNLDDPREWFLGGIVTTDDGAIRMVARELFLGEEIAHSYVLSGDCDPVELDDS